MTNKNLTLLAHLEQLESELKQNQLWSNMQPTTEQLNSQTPFAADVMPFENWLQFIFIPRFKHMLNSNAQLPTNMSITPMAEISFGSQYQELISTLQNIDRLVQE